MGASEMTQMNTRIAVAEKKAGDRVLAKYGITPSAAVRGLWRFLGEKKTIPPFFFLADCHEGVAETVDGPATGHADEGAGMAARMAKSAGLPAAFQGYTFEELRELAFEEGLAENV